MGTTIGEGRPGASVRSAAEQRLTVMLERPVLQDFRAGDEGRVEVKLCGGLRVTAGGCSVGPRQLGGAKPRQILLALLLRREQAVCKESLVHLLWGDTPPTGALGTLEKYVSLLRKRLDGVTPGLGGAVRTVPGGYVLDLTGIDVDVHRFRDLSAAARTQGPAAAVRRYAEALDVVNGILLPDEQLSWVEDARVCLGAELLQVLHEAADAALSVNDVDRADRWARCALEGDPFDENAWRVVLECCGRRGLHAEGLRAYNECRRIFADELGCSPGPAVRGAFQQLLDSIRQVDDDPLAALVDAVVRLHLVISSAGRTSPALTDGGSLGPPGVELEEDWRLLERFLAAARRRRLDPSRLSA